MRSCGKWLQRPGSNQRRQGYGPYLNPILTAKRMTMLKILADCPRIGASMVKMCPPRHGVNVNQVSPYVNWELFLGVDPSPMSAKRTINLPEAPRRQCRKGLPHASMSCWTSSVLGIRSSSSVKYTPFFSASVIVFMPLLTDSMSHSI